MTASVRARRGRAVAVVAVLALGLAACAPALPDSVVPDTRISAGWSGELTSVNAAASPTRGNQDIAATVRAGFGAVVDGEFVPDTGFGTVAIVGDDPFTVRYDLAEPAWSDGIPLDAADLLLGWAGASGYFPAEGEAASADAEADVPRIDEFARSIDVAFAEPVSTWQSAVTVPVPAHVLGEKAFGIDDAMEAKQRVITAIQDGDSAALAAMAEVWNTGFELPEKGEIPADLRVSSGPFLVQDVETADAGQSVTLVPNPGYRGLPTPQVARIDLVPQGDDALTVLGDTLDIAGVAPTAATRAPVDELERQDFTVDTAQDGTMWALQLRPSGVFSGGSARTAFLHAAPANTLVAGGGGVWASSYTGTTSMLSAPGSRAYDIVAEDSGFATSIGEPGDDVAVERDAAGIPAGATVCVAYDRASEFASGAFAALRTVVAEAGWSVTDCGTDDIAGAIAQGGWDAVIARVPIPQTPAEILAQWGTQATASVSASADPARDELVAQLARTTDVYEYREALAQVEASIVQAAVALPLAVNPRITVSDRSVTGIAARNGAVAPLTSGAVQWAVVP